MGAERRKTELVEILNLVEDIGAIADSGRGSDESSNAALDAIKIRCGQLVGLVRSYEGSDTVDVARLLAMVQQVIRP